MYRYLAVLNGDNINRYGFRFTIGALEGSLYENATIGVPSLLGHDSHRHIGWGYPIGLYFEPKITKLIGEFILAETNDDREKIENAYQNTLLKSNYKICKPHLDNFSELLQLDSVYNEKFIHNGCVLYKDKDILFKYYPNLKGLQDKDGLIYLDDLLSKFEYLGQGIFKDKKSDISIFSHRYFRRNLSHHNNYHTFFLDEFIRLNDEQGINLRIALDCDIVGYAPSYMEQIELAFWWGPKFNDNIDDIPPGVTHYESNEKQKLFSGVSGTQFWWKKDEEGMMTLEVEEIRVKPSLGVSDEKYGCRYIHSIYDSKKSDFIHFDGAIRMYDEMGIIERWENPINQVGKNTTYTKLFRIDGKLSLANWKSLSVNYFQDNPLLYEYFGKKNEYKEIQKKLIETENKSVVEKLIPYKIDNKSGIRIFVSYHLPTHIEEDFERIIINPDSIYNLKDRSEVIEFDTLEIKKALFRLGGELKLPSEYSYIKSYDFYTNYPTILHSTNNLRENLSKTLKAYLLVFESISKKMERTISLTLACPHGDKEVRVSIFGNITEIIKWLKQNSEIPLEREEFRSWLDKQNKWLSDNYEYQENKPDLFDLIKSDGVIYIKRNSINPDWITDLRKDEMGIKYKLEIPKGNEDILEAVSKKEIFPAFSSIVTKVRCGKTNEDYFESKTSKVLDEDVHAIIEEASLAGTFWTDRQYF